MRMNRVDRRDLLQNIAEETQNSALAELLDMTPDDLLDTPEIAMALAWGRPGGFGLLQTE